MKILNSLIFCWCFAICLTGSINLSAQSTTLDNISSAYLQKSGVINGENAISGYYFLTQKVEPKQKGRKKSDSENTYVLTLMDQDLNTIGSKEFSSAKGFSVLDVAYNGDFLAVKMVNFETKKKWVELLDAAGNTVLKKTLTFGPYDIPMMYESMASMGAKHIVPVNGGFLSFDNTTQNEKLMGKSMYRIKYISNDKENRGWSVVSSKKSKDFEGAGFIAANDSIAVFSIWKKANLMTMKMRTEMLAYNIKTGKRVFAVRSDSKTMPIRWQAGAFIGDELVLGGMNVGESGKIFTDAPAGLNRMKLTMDGKVISEKEISLSENLTQFDKPYKDGKIAGMGNLFIHHLAIAEDGSVIVAGEFYKAFNGGITARDGVLLHLTPDFELANVAVVEKGKSNDGKGLTSRGGISLTSKKTSALIAASRGEFDFGMLNAADDVITAAYFSGRQKVRKEKKLSLYVNTLLDGELSEEIITFDANSDSVRVLPAKSGYVMVMEYDGDAKKLNIHMERLRL